MLEADAEVDRRDFTVRAALTVAPGERLALFGPSGAGKTTILEMIAGLVQPRRALILLGGRVLTCTDKPVTVLAPWQRGVGLLRQDPGLFPHLTVRANLLYGRAGGPLQDRSARAGAVSELGELAGVLGIEELLESMPARLSGGQAHRAALGRLLLSHCDALLLDEPYTGLDASLRRTLTDLVVSLVAERGVPSILVAHELAEAQAFADRLAVLDRGQILQTGAPGEIVLEPATRRVAERAVRLKYLLEELDLTPIAKSKAYQLSGGEKRRLEITRALVTSPKLLLLDEPFSGIDPIAVYEVQKIVRRLKERGLGILITDHNVRETLKLIDRGYIIHKGQVLVEGSSEFLTNDPKAREIYLGPEFNL